jgi:tetratricopeptide (TPR) repeat protein
VIRKRREIYGIICFVFVLSLRVIFCKSTGTYWGGTFGVEREKSNDENKNKQKNREKNFSILYKFKHFFIHYITHSTDKKHKSTITAALMETSSIKAGRPPYARILQNFLLIWLDGNIDAVNNEECCNSIRDMRQVVNSVNTFKNADECIRFIDGIDEEKVFIISSGALGQTTVPLVHNKPQVSAIFVFCGNKTWHETWTKQWPKVKGVFTEIAPICEALKQAAQDCDRNSISISFFTTHDGISKENADRRSQSFIHAQILKEVLLTIDFGQEHINKFFLYCREQFVGNSAQLKNIDKLEKEYRHRQPIWWYTYDCFLYSMLNRALRTMELDLIMKLGFFVRHLHDHITQLYMEQYAGQNHSNSFTVYRGQGLSQTDFDELLKMKGGLVSFNNFLFASKNRNVSFEFARRTTERSDLVGILFAMQVDPSTPSAPFANVRCVGASQTEEEILFSMYSIFRLGQIKQIGEKNRLWQVDLTLASNDDPQLRALTERIREDNLSGYEGWYKLGELLINISHFNMAQQVYQVLLNQASNDSDIAFIYNRLGYIKDNEGLYEEAITSYKRAIEMYETHPPNYPALANSYTAIGLVYKSIGEYSQALSYYEKAHEIDQMTLPPNHPDMATSYKNIGLLYDQMGDYSTALSYHGKVLEIYQETLPPNHPDVAECYNNIGLVYDHMGEHSQALLYHEKDLEIKPQTLRPDHPDLAGSYNNVAVVYHKMGDYTKALPFYEHALVIGQRSLPADHPRVQLWKKNLENVKNKL